MHTEENIIKIRRQFIEHNAATFSFSQVGEDTVLYALFNKKISSGYKGFYVDVGAYHPYKYSNTYLFYIYDWKGINIEPCPGSIELFNKIRPRDINIECGIGEKKEILPLYLVENHSTMNSFSKEHLQELNVYKDVKKQHLVKLYTLKDILDQHSTSFSKIDFLTIDTEGFDHQVLMSNDWDKYKPDVIVVELVCENFLDLENNPSSIFLCGLGYEIIAKNIILRNLASVFYVSIDFDY